MARWQIVVKTSEATKQTKDQNDNKKQTNKTKQKQQQQNRRRGQGLKNKQLNEWSSDVVIIIDLRETERGRGLKRVLLRLYPSQIWQTFTDLQAVSLTQKIVDYSKYFLISF